MAGILTKPGGRNMPAKKFDPKSLSVEQQESVIEEYLGIHPRYFVYRGITIEVDIYSNRRNGNSFNGFLPDLEKRKV